MGNEVNKLLVALVLLMTVTLGGALYFKSQVGPSTTAEEATPRLLKPNLPEKPSEPQVTYDDALQSITEEELKEMLYHLADYEKYKGRATGQPGNAAAAAWLKKQFESYGLPTMYDEFRTSRGNTKNVYAWIEGSEAPEEIIVLGAHFDHISSSPGADDNASGTVLVLETAEALAMLPREEIRRTIVFQLYSGEEMGLLGSRHYCANPKFPKKAPSMQKHVFMLNADMVGRLNSQQYLMLFDEKMDDVGQMVQDLSNKYPFALSITRRGSGGSDQTPFLNKGVDVAWLFTGQHRDYHRPTDTADKIDYDGLEKITRYAYELIYRVDHNKRHLCMWNTDYGDHMEKPTQHKAMFDHDNPNVPFPEPLE